MSDDIEKMLRAWRWEFAPIPVRELCERAADTIAELRKEVERLAREDEVHWKTRRTLLAQLAEANAVLDEASPLMQCARCRKESRAHTMMPEEGDEWECLPCWHEQNAKERAALAAERSSNCELCGCSVPKGAACECWLPP